jgi:hypothetical protein
MLMFAKDTALTDEIIKDALLPAETPVDTYNATADE